MFYIGIDLGTSSVKLLLMDSEGNVVNTVSEEYPIYFPKSGWSEQNPEDWYASVIDGIKKLTCGIDKDKVAGISFGGQMHGLVILDENDKVIRPCILWNDGRTKKECDYLNNVIGKEKLSDCTANIAFAGFTAPKILWLKENEPENFKAVKKIMLPKDYLAYMMTGVFSTDVSDASGTLLFDVKRRCWSEEMCNLCGISKEMLPKVYESYECTGTVLEHPIAKNPSHKKNSSWSSRQINIGTNPIAPIRTNPKSPLQAVKICLRNTSSTSSPSRWPSNSISVILPNYTILTPPSSYNHLVLKNSHNF